MSCDGAFSFAFSNAYDRRCIRGLVLYFDRLGADVRGIIGRLLRTSRSAAVSGFEAGSAYLPTRDRGNVAAAAAAARIAEE